MSRSQSRLGGKEKRLPKSLGPFSPLEKADAQVRAMQVQQVLEEGGWVHLF